LFVLRQDHRFRRINVNDFNPRRIVSKEINPSLAGLPRNVRCIEDEVPADAQILAALFTRGLAIGYLRKG
jgi:hypothetical protein